MKVICSWCDKDLGEKEPLADTRVSHGMCEDCRKKIMEGMKKEKRDDKVNSRCIIAVGCVLGRRLCGSSIP